MSHDATATTSPLARGTWNVDSNHSGVHFKVRHIGLSNVRGRFNRFEATLTVGDSVADTRVQGTVYMDSVDTNQPVRDRYLGSTEFFSTDKSPTMTFRSTAVNARSGTYDYDLDGELTINRVTRPVTLAVKFLGVETYPIDGRMHAGFVTTTVVNRDDFGIDFNMPLGIDKFAIGKKVAVELELQFVEPAGG